jgi:hypothetical protein
METVDRILKGYKLEAELGRGGQAIVYRATQLSLQRTVALKVVSEQLSSDANFKERFTREGIAAANLDHPHVIPVFEAGEAEGLAYLAMKYVDGPSFDRILHQPGGLEPRRTLAILRQVAEALDYMAERGMVHRDVKPANILLGPGDHAYLSDFGLIKAISAARLTSSGVWMGTLEYVAPEQIRGGEITPAADRYALAALAFEALTGRVLFPREDRTATLFAHVNDEPPPASGLNPGLGPHVDAVLSTGLAKDPGQRHPSAVAFVDALAEAVARTPGAAEARPPLAAAAPPPPPPPPSAAEGSPARPGGPTVTGESGAVPAASGESGSGRRRTMLIAGGAIALALLVVLGIMFAAGVFSGETRTITTYVLGERQASAGGGSDAPAAGAGAVEASSLEATIRRQYAELKPGLTLIRISCDDLQATVGAAVSCAARNSNDVALEIGGGVTSVDGDDVGYRWEVTRAIAPGRLYAAAASGPIQAFSGQEVESVLCPPRVEVVAGTEIACTAETPAGASLDVTLRLTDADGAFEVTAVA